MAIDELEKPTISVIIPTYNRSDLLLNAIESVLNQTYGAYEIIVVDDGSTDDTAARLAQYTGRIRYFHQQNHGASSAQNRGIQLARGEWISILASDDQWMPTKLEWQIKALRILGPRVGACFTDCVLSGKSKPDCSVFEIGGLNNLTEIGLVPDPFSLILGQNSVIFVQSLMVRKSLVDSIGGFDESMVVSEDVDLLFRLAFRTQFCFVNKKLVRIDADYDRDRLTQLFVRKDDQMFASQSHMLRKWLMLPELADPTTLRRIQILQIDVHYDWILTKLWQFRFGEFFNKIRLQHQNGVRYVDIIFELARRAVRRLSSIFGSRASERKGNV